MNAEQVSWPIDAPLERQTLLAQCVLEGLPAFERIAHDAQERLGKDTGDPAFDAYESNAPARVRAQCRALYEEIRALGLTYRVEPQENWRFNEQTVRLADEVLSAKHGTCIDLVLLLAGALKHVGIFPLIVVVGDDNSPTHALLGYWTAEYSVIVHAMPRTVLTGDVLSEHRDHIGFVDCARLAGGSSWDFDVAEREALATLPPCPGARGIAAPADGSASARGGSISIDAVPGQPPNLVEGAFQDADRRVGREVWYAVDVHACRRIGIWSFDGTGADRTDKTSPADGAPAWYVSDRAADRQYRENIVFLHERVRVLRRARLVDVEHTYITLWVADYVPVQESPDEGSRRDAPSEAQHGRIEATRALSLQPCRLAVLGEPGSGKTFLLHYLALVMAKQGRPSGAPWWKRPRFAETARALVRHGPAHTVHRAERTLARVRVPGTGLFLRWTAGALQSLGDRLTRYPLPFYITLNDLARSREPLETHLAAALAQAGFRRPEERLARTLRNGGFLVLLDALDEVVDERARNRMIREIDSFTQRYPRVPLVVTCRTATFRDGRSALSPFYRLEVQPFSEADFEPFVRSWFEHYPAEKATGYVNGLMRLLEPDTSANAPDHDAEARHGFRMRYLARNPLLLSLICLHYERHLRLPDRRVELYKLCADELLHERDTEHGLVARFKPDAKRAALRVIAHRFHELGQQGLGFGRQPLIRTLAKLLTALALDGADANAFLSEIIERSGLIRPLSRTSYGFFHFTLQEFFVAEWFHERKRSPLRHLGDPRWREVILLYVALADDPTARLRQVKGHDVVFAAMALADSVEASTAAFQGIALEVVGELKRLIEDDPVRRQEAADALAVLGRWGATEYLVERARSGLADGAEAGTRQEVALASILALERVGYPRGATLRLLPRHLGKVSDAVDTHILALLEHLGVPLVHVPAGEFIMGSEDEDDEKSVHTVRLEGYWIGKYPVTNALYGRFCAETGHTNRGSAAAPGKDDHPVVDVSWHDAIEFCRWAGMMLPNEAEWEKGARGTDGRRYPWGDQWDPKRCNVGSSGTSPVRAYPGDVSPYGSCGMAGNVREWTRSLCEDGDYLSENTPVARWMRGGSFLSWPRDARAAYRYGADPGTRGDHIGFRVVVSPFTSDL